MAQTFKVFDPTTGQYVEKQIEGMTPAAEAVQNVAEAAQPVIQAVEQAAQPVMQAVEQAAQPVVQAVQQAAQLSVIHAGGIHGGDQSRSGSLEDGCCSHNGSSRNNDFSRILQTGLSVK